MYRVIGLMAAVCWIGTETYGAYTTVVVPSGPNSTLESYLCNGSLLTNGTTLQLGVGEHVISPGSFCLVRNLKDIAITGAGRDLTVVRCGDGGRGFRFSFVWNLTLAKMAFVDCGLATTVPSPFVGNMSSPVVLYMDSTFVTIQQVTINNFCGFGVFGYALYSSVLSDLQFINCLGNCSGAVLYATSVTPTFTVQGCLFQNLSYSDSLVLGAGLTLWQVYNYVTVRDCLFNNLASLLGSLVVYEAVATVTNCTFVSQFGGAVGAYYSYVFVINSTFATNFAPVGAAIKTKYNYYLSISGSTFDGNVATQWGGAVSLFEPASGLFYTTMEITSCSFTNNTAQVGGAVFIFHSPSSSEVTIDQSAFLYNSAPTGAAIYAGDFRNRDGSRTYALVLRDVQVEDNRCLSCSIEQDVMGAAVYYSELSDVYIYSYSGKGSRFVGNSPQGAIQGLSGGLHLYGNIMFINNTGESGGAIGLLNNAHLYFYPYCNVSFEGNTATTYGGALYIQGDPNIPASILIECRMHFVGPQENYSIIFSDNAATVSGQSIYATPIYDCTLSIPAGVNNSALYNSQPSAYYDHIFSFTSAHNNTSSIQILSFPAEVLLCGCDKGTNCDLSNGYKISTTPGRTIRFSATSIDHENHTSPAVITTNVPPNSQGISLAPQQNVQWIGKMCDVIEYEIYGQENVTINLQLTTYMGAVPTIVQVTIRPCDPGFVLANDSTTGLMQCTCSSFLVESNVGCNIASGTVTRKGNKWIGVYNNGTRNLSALAYTCPLDYCKSNFTQISLASPNDLCDKNRQGLMCGHCPANFSVVFGSSECQLCSDIWLFTILLYAVLGIVLVTVLFMLNLTVTQGTIYGLIFYANIIQVNTSVFFNQPSLKPLQIVVSFLNLDLGFPLCFYDGMDDAAKAGLQFVFPAYLLTLTITVVTVCHYCLRESTGPNITHHCLNRTSHFIGKRAVSVLATLVYLSYSKVLRTVIEILTYATIQVDGGTHFRVWFYDGTARYLEGRHLILFIIAIASSTFFLVPYTLALTLIPIIDRYSDHSKLLHWLNQKANLLKPMNDAYYATYKGAWQCWLGVRLWLLIFLYTPTPFYSSDSPSLLMYIHGIILVAFLFIQAHIKPFGELYNAGNKPKWICAGIYNWIDSFYIFNYIVLAFTVSYLISNDAYNNNHIAATVGSLVGLSVAMIFATIVFHIIAVLCTYSTREAVKAADDAGNEVELEKPSLSDVSYMIVTENDLREPLMEDL